MRSSPRGVTLVEAIVALALLGGVLVISLGLVLWADAIQERARQKTVAAELAASVAERIRAARFESIHTTEISLIGEVAASLLTDPHVELEVEEDLDAGLKHVGIVVTWQGERASKFRLDTVISSREPYR